jgi:hypothetical protein
MVYLTYKINLGGEIMTIKRITIYLDDKLLKQAKLEALKNDMPLSGPTGYLTKLIQNDLKREVK